MELTAGVYRHYKGPHYVVLGLAHDADGGEDRVVYVPLYEVSGAPLAVRTLSGFTETVTLDTGEQVPRFAYVGSRLG